MADDIEFAVDNILQADGDVYDTSEPGPVSIRCPHCRERGIFPSSGTGIRYNKWTKKKNTISLLEIVLRQCPNNVCRGFVTTVEDHTGLKLCMPPEIIDFDDKGLPDDLLKTLSEAIACHAAGAYRAAAMMVRRLLEEICEDSGATGKDLHHRLQDLRSKIILPEELFEAMSELKAIGNDAAHIEAKQYDRIEKDEAEDTIELAKEILKARYQLKGLVARLQARKKK